MELCLCEKMTISNNIEYKEKVGKKQHLNISIDSGIIKPQCLIYIFAKKYQYV